ncbi:hypothetical protein [Nocardioides houyundeii]|uniref:hypothetical protein n=1 Tax=Nocardioides houyundeii TaxID=2045452 RepID=UPI0013157F62|nr:hypothetical protein [Nocardioides houyundeii]
MNSSAPTPDERTVVAKIIDWWLGRVWPDWAIVALVVLVHLALYRWGPWVDWAIRDIPTEQRRFIYVGLATVAALVAGSNNTAVGSYVSSAGDVMKDIRISHGRSMRKSLRSNGIWLWLVAVVSLVCIALDPMQAAHPGRTRGAAWVAEAALLLIIVKYGRLVMMQDVLLAANDLSRQREVVKQRAREPRQFKRPVVK